MSLIAEGWVRRSKKEKLHHIEIAEGSLQELENHGEVALLVNYWTQEQYAQFNSQRAKVSYLIFRYK